ncbi:MULTISPECIES: hypothetical protein [unclassified Robinsoniella]|uniref:hypothetical protein n=1 Tax=unclassified Robinsoniella TaxID=2630858 RepID=UPI0012DFB26D|nr:hypothetical protein [Robinsoniella sp. KNHs210]
MTKKYIPNVLQDSYNDNHGVAGKWQKRGCYCFESRKIEKLTEFERESLSNY